MLNRVPIPSWIVGLPFSLLPADTQPVTPLKIDISHLAAFLVDRYISKHDHNYDINIGVPEGTPSRMESHGGNGIQGPGTVDTVLKASA